MKKCLLTILFGTASFFSASATEPVTFYGVDFTLSRVYGADESIAKFREAFSGINGLFVSEEEKYDVAALTREEVASNRISVARKSSDEHFSTADVADVFYLDEADYDCRDSVAGLLRRYELPEGGGRGMVMVANLLDKAHGVGDFYLVIFDIGSREIESCCRISGRAGGFGLRNYWANAVRLALKQYPRIRKKTL